MITASLIERFICVAILDDIHTVKYTEINCTTTNVMKVLISPFYYILKYI